MLYLILSKLLDSPILYLSRYIIRTKLQYYKLLQEIRIHENWEELIELLFQEFDTKTIYIENGLSVSRKTASSYLSSLEKEGFRFSEKIGRERIYLNKMLFDMVKYSVEENDVSR